MPVALVFHVFSYVSFGIVPLAQTTTGLFSTLSASTTDEDLVAAQLLSFGSVLMFDFAWRLSTSRPRKLVMMRRDDAPLRTIARIIGCVGLVASAVYVSAVGVGTLFSSRQDLTESFSAAVAAEGSQATTAILTAVGTVPVLIAALLYIVLLQEHRRILHGLDYALFIAVLIFNLMVNNPISNSRYWELAVIVGFLLAIFRRKPAVLAWIGVSAILSAILLFPFADFSRYAAGENFSPTVQGDPWEVIAQKDYDQFTMTANSLAYVRANGVAWGYQMLGAVLFWVPRSIWPSKPLDTGVAIGQWMQVSNVNLSSPLWAEGWVNLGLAGSIVLVGVLGVLAGALDSNFAKTEAVRGRVASLTFTFVFSGYEFILLRGPLLQAMGRLGVLITVAVFIYIAAGRKMSRSAMGGSLGRGVVSVGPAEH